MPYPASFLKITPDANLARQFDNIRTAKTAIDAAVALILAETPSQAIVDQCTAITAQTTIIAANVPATS